MLAGVARGQRGASKCDCYPSVEGDHALKLNGVIFSKNAAHFSLNNNAEAISTRAFSAVAGISWLFPKNQRPDRFLAIVRLPAIISFSVVLDSFRLIDGLGPGV